jgi:hypothetical protein
VSAPEKPASTRTAWTVGVVASVFVLGLVVAACLGMVYVLYFSVNRMQRQVADLTEQVRQEAEAAEERVHAERRQRRADVDAGEQLAQKFLDHLQAGRFSEARACGTKSFANDHKVADLAKLVAEAPVLRERLQPGNHPPMDDEGPYLKYVFVPRTPKEDTVARQVEVIVKKDGAEFRIDGVGVSVP